jgi:hypothetical protein
METAGKLNALYQKERRRAEKLLEHLRCRPDAYTAPEVAAEWIDRADRMTGRGQLDRPRPNDLRS